MRGKIFLISLALLFFTCCFENCPPTKPEDPTEELPESGDIEAHYYRINTELAENADIVKIFFSWRLLQGELMNRIEEDHFQLDLKSVPNNFDHRGDIENVHFIRIMDARRTRQITEKIVLNGVELKYENSDEDEGTEEIFPSFYLYFWFDGKTIYIK